jgi:5-methylcytosine-specific restriction endonuclease McrA
MDQINMKNLGQVEIKSLSNEDLLLSTERTIEQERKIVQVLIWHLQEIQDRKLYLSLGYESLYKCLIGQFKMSDTTAYGRIKVLKILEEVPEVSDGIKSGALNISNIALAHSFIEKHQKLTGEELSLDDKLEIFENLKDKTMTEAIEFFARCNPETSLPHDEIRVLTENHSQMRSTLTNKLIEKINYLKSLISHEHINPTHEELLTLAFDAFIEKAEKKRGIHQKMSSTQKKAFKDKSSSESYKNPQTNINPSSNSSNESMTPPTQSFTDGNSRYVPREVKRFIRNRAQNQCEHIHISGERCLSKFQLQFDHIIAFSKGGKATTENMQLLCRVHNAFKHCQ